MGTFPSAEADEKCARAKALTRAWRSTMRPKPSRDWVMLELERLGVRVVSGRLGRKAGEEDEVEKKPVGKCNTWSSCAFVFPPLLASHNFLDNYLCITQERWAVEYHKSQGTTVWAGLPMLT